MQTLKGSCDQQRVLAFDVTFKAQLPAAGATLLSQVDESKRLTVRVAPF